VLVWLPVEVVVVVVVACAKTLAFVERAATTEMARSEYTTMLLLLMLKPNLKLISSVSPPVSNAEMPW